MTHPDPAPAFAIRPVAGGVEADGGGLAMQLLALREDVLRIRIGRDGVLPPDESWAALLERRQARCEEVQLRADGFATACMSVQLDPSTGRIVVRDAEGRDLLAGLSSPVRPVGKRGYRLDFQLSPTAHVFGLGDKTGPLDRRGRALSLWNTDAYRFQEATDPLYKAIPFFTLFDRGQAAGVFLDTPWRSVFDIGVERLDALSVGADDGPIDLYVFAGPSPKAVLAGYAWLTGPAPLPPLWAFGFQQSRYSYSTGEEAGAVADRLRADRIPADVIWLDIGALDRNRAFTLSGDGFPDPAGFVRGLEAQGLHTVVITDLHLAASPGYGPYDSGAAGDHLLRLADGSLYQGEVWPGACVFPQFTDATSRAWWGGLFDDLYRHVGMAGFWNDMNEPAIFDQPTKTMPPEVRHRIAEPGFEPRTATHAEIHNLYGMLNSRATYEGLLALDSDRRPFVMTRASFAGGQRYAVTWTGDNSSTFNHLRLSTPELLSLGLSGFAFAGCDLGGFAGAPTAELLTRWLQLGMFNPIARDHTDFATPPQEPWVDGEAHLAIRRRFIETRYRLLPYIYTAAEEASRTGAPMMRPLFMEFPAILDGHPLDLDAPAQFMWGESLMVAPSPWPESPEPYDVFLPPGVWWDFWTGERVEGLEPMRRAAHPELGVPPALPAMAGLRRIRVTPRLEHLPVFVRGGAIIPSQPLVQSTGERPEGPLSLDIYPGTAGMGAVYADDGVSHAYRRGESFRQRFTCEETPDGLRVEILAAEGRFTPWWERVRVVVHGAAHLQLSSAPGVRGVEDARPDVVVVEVDGPAGRGVSLQFTPRV